MSNLVSQSTQDESVGNVEKKEVHSRKDVVEGLGTQTEANADNGEETGDISGVVFEGHGNRVLSGDNEAEGATVKSTEIDGSGETMVGDVWNEEERCPWLPWGGMRLS